MGKIVRSIIPEGTGPGTFIVPSEKEKLDRQIRGLKSKLKSVSDELKLQQLENSRGKLSSDLFIFQVKTIISDFQLAKLQLRKGKGRPTQDKIVFDFEKKLEMLLK